MCDPTGRPVNKLPDKVPAELDVADTVADEQASVAVAVGNCTAPKQSLELVEIVKSANAFTVGACVSNTLMIWKCSTVSLVHQSTKI